MTEFEPVVGLEVHAELLTKSKMFCGCAVVDSTAASPNTSVCEICTGMPGTLPVINQRAVEYALSVALALGATPAEISVFARKNYFYPDLPKGYQISQYELPLARGGQLLIESNGGEKSIRIRRVHLEEDTGKLFHRDGYSLVDYNRSGVPLLEIVSEPDMNSVDQVKSFAQELRSVLRYLGVNSGDMEKGVIRFEANISVRPCGSDEIGTRTEIKNLNSFRTMVRAVEFEFARQSQILSSGGTVLQETVGWDEKTNTTVPQRSKEEAHDYRYFPEPDLPPLYVSPAWVAELQASLPELPRQKRVRYIRDYDLSPAMAALLAEDRSVAEYFDAVVASSPGTAPEKIANWISGDFFALLNDAGIEIQHSKIPPEDFGRLVQMVEQGKINTTSAKTVLEEMFRSGGSPEEIVRSQSLEILQDSAAIQEIIQTILDEHPDQLNTYLEGKRGVLEWFFGQVMRVTGGRADPSLVRQLLTDALDHLEEGHLSGM